jgi:hypothetical protein
MIGFEKYLVLFSSYKLDAFCLEGQSKQQNPCRKVEGDSASKEIPSF